MNPHLIALGQRIAKIVIPRTAAGPEPQSEWMYTIYVRDAQGNVMATYSRFFETCGTMDWRDKLQLNEQYIYGSARVGMLNRAAYVSKCFTTSDHMSAQDGYQAFGSTSYVVSSLVYSHEMSSNDILPYEKSVIFVSRKTYEFSDHLGNVSATISDRKITIAIGGGNAVASYTPEVLSEQDYFPFGMGMMERSVTAEGYRYGFNGKEKESDTFEGAYDFGARILDTRLGRWLSVDPLQVRYPSLSVFCQVGNNPLIFIDPDGKKILIHYIDEKGESRYVDYRPGIKPANNDVFVSQVHEAISEIIKYDETETWQKLDADEDLVIIEFTDMDLDDMARMESDPNCTDENGKKQLEVVATIQWNPNLASETSDGGGNAPSTKLFHEACHSLRYLEVESRKQYQELNEDREKSHPKYHNFEEARVMAKEIAYVQARNLARMKAYLKDKSKEFPEQDTPRNSHNSKNGYQSEGVNSIRPLDPKKQIKGVRKRGKS